MSAGGERPLRRRFGAVPVGRRRGRAARLGAERALARRRPRRGPTRARACRRRRLPARFPARASDEYLLVVDGQRRVPIHARVRSRTACAARRRSSTPPRSRGPTRAGRALRSTISSIYELHVGTFTEEGTFDAAIPHLRGPARAGRDRDRAHAGRDVSRRARLGLRRPLQLSAAPRVRRARRARAPRRCCARRRARSAARRRLQPCRSGQRGAARVRAVLHEQA